MITGLRPKIAATYMIWANGQQPAFGGDSMSDQHQPQPSERGPAAPAPAPGQPAPIDQWGRPMLWSVEHQHWVAQPAPYGQQPAAPAAAPIVVQNNMAAMAQPATKGPNHVLHGLLTLFTAGLWLPVWIVIAMRNKQKPV